MSVISIYNIKGGVGKTATAVNLSYIASTGGSRILLCDMDPQGAASYYFRIKADRKFNSGKMLKGGEHIVRNIRGTDFPDLDLLPSDFSFRNMDLALDDFKNPTQRIRKVLKPLQEDYDTIFLDCPPNITLLSENIFHASDCIVVPLIPTTLSVLALKKFLEFVSDIKLKHVRIFVFFSMVESRKKMHIEIIGKLRKKKGFLKTMIPFLADIEKMGTYRQPVPAVLPGSVASTAYQNLWLEISMKLEER